MTGRTNVGGGKVDINVRNVSVLPLSGRANDVVIVNANDVTDVYLTNNEPTSPSEGTVWLKCQGKSNAYLTIGNIKVYVTSALQYTNGAWVVLGKWYVHDGANWVRGRVYIVQDGVASGYIELKTYNGGTLDLTANPISYLKSTGSSAASGGVLTGVDYFAEFSTVSFRGTWSAGGGAQYGFVCYFSIHADGASMDSGFAVSAKSASRTDVASVLTLPITYSDLPCVIQFNAYIQRNGNQGKFAFYDLYLD